MRRKRQEKEDRISLSKANLDKVWGERYAEFMAKQDHERRRDERLENLRLLNQEEGKWKHRVHFYSW